MKTRELSLPSSLSHPIDTKSFAVDVRASRGRNCHPLWCKGAGTIPGDTGQRHRSGRVFAAPGPAARPAIPSRRTTTMTMKHRLPMLTKPYRSAGYRHRSLRAENDLARATAPDSNGRRSREQWKRRGQAPRVVMCRGAWPDARDTAPIEGGAAAGNFHPTLPGTSSRARVRCRIVHHSTRAFLHGLYACIRTGGLPSAIFPPM